MGKEPVEIKEEVIIQYVCGECGEMMHEDIYGNKPCYICMESLNIDDKILCFGEGKHCHQECYKKTSSSTNKEDLE